MAVFTKAHHWFLSWARWIQFTHTHKRARAMSTNPL